MERVPRCRVCSPPQGRARGYCHRLVDSGRWCPWPTSLGSFGEGPVEDSRWILDGAWGSRVGRRCACFSILNVCDRRQRWSVVRPHAETRDPLGSWRSTRVSKVQERTVSQKFSYMKDFFREPEDCNASAKKGASQETLVRGLPLNHGRRTRDGLLYL